MKRNLGVLSTHCAHSLRAVARFSCTCPIFMHCENADGWGMQQRRTLGANCTTAMRIAERKRVVRGVQLGLDPGRMKCLKRDAVTTLVLCPRECLVLHSWQ